MEIVIGIVVGLVIGGGVVALIMKNSMKGQANQILKDAEADAEVIKKEKILQAKEKFLQLKEEHEKMINNKNNKMAEAEKRIKQKETSLNQKLGNVNKEQRQIDSARESLKDEYVYRNFVVILQYELFDLKNCHL